MACEGSITRCIDLLKRGDRAAAQPLWDRYFQRLVELARARLRVAPRRLADEEDVALSAESALLRLVGKQRKRAREHIVSKLSHSQSGVQSSRIIPLDQN